MTGLLDKSEIGVVGIGSPFGADNVAEHVIVLLKKELDQNHFNNKIQIEYFDRPGMHLLDYMNGFKCVHLIDAIVSGKSVGSIHRYEETSVLFGDNQLLSSHSLGVNEVLSLANALNYLPENVIIHGIEIENDNSMNSSNTINNACNTLAKRVAKELIQSMR